MTDDIVARLADSTNTLERSNLTYKRNELRTMVAMMRDEVEADWREMGAEWCGDLDLQRLAHDAMGGM